MPGSTPSALRRLEAEGVGHFLEDDRIAVDVAGGNDGVAFVELRIKIEFGKERRVNGDAGVGLGAVGVDSGEELGDGAKLINVVAGV